MMDSVVAAVTLAIAKAAGEKSERLVREPWLLTDSVYVEMAEAAIAAMRAQGLVKP